MPMRSRRQWRKLFALQGRGELPKGTAQEFAHATKGGYKSLPERAGAASRRRRRQRKQQ